jgi:hypothetical protein
MDMRYMTARMVHHSLTHISRGPEIAPHLPREESHIATAREDKNVKRPASAKSSTNK